MANQEVSASGMQIGNWVMYVSNLGQSIIIGNTIMNFALATAQGAAEFASTSVTSWGGSGALAGVAMYWISFFKVINGIFAMYGIGYAYLIPMAPVLIFGMGYLSVLLLQSSGIIISPMVPAVAFRPEGKGMSGQNLGRTLGWTYTLVFQAPALIAGFVLSMFITGIGYVFFNTVFFMIFGQGSWMLNPYNLIGMATLHFAGLTILLHTCFKSGIVFKDLFLDFVSGKDYNMGGHIDNISTDRVGQSLMDAGANSKVNLGAKVGEMIAQKRLGNNRGGQGKTK
ncbi:hypothetical protein BC443_15015 [Salinicola sp. MIT1003]|nr:hypothetical protein BC443_15015 [Salinicola sp. MIT1003]